MGNIKEYTPQGAPISRSPQRQATAEDFGADVARGVSRFAESVGQLGARVKQKDENDDLRLANREAARIRSQATVRLNDLQNNADLEEDIFDRMNEDFGNFSSQPVDFKTDKGRQVYENLLDGIKNDISQRAIIGQSKREGEKARIDFGQELDFNTNTVFSDPTQFGSVADQLLESISDPDGRFSALSAKDRAILADETKKRLAVSAIRGTIAISPELAETQLDSARWDDHIDAEEKKVLMAETKTAQRAGETELNRASKAAKDALKAKQEVTRNDFLLKMENNQLTTADVLASDLPAFGGGSKKVFIDMIDKQAKEPAITDPKLYMDLYTQIFDAEGIEGVDDIIKFVGDGLSAPDAEKLRKIWLSNNNPESKAGNAAKKRFVTMAKSAITKSTLFASDPKGDENFYNFQVVFEKELAAKLNEGIPMSRLLDPQDKNYMGFLIQPYVRGPQQILKDMSDQFKQSSSATDGGALPPEKKRLPNESATDYLKRTGQIN
jgi:hypothetical protein